MKMRSIILCLLFISGIALTSCTNDTADSDLYEENAVRKDETIETDT